ncbi:proline dehydrogenase 1, mitochondrial-like [Limulus polyphemus]|uniref:Proline dehydrogenase n=1 Tax=Limulus polyphemus TaxID=6850 RepID=A0ABM1B442_LIMPO|nr:proline dehydrogenase 1, mitochondrial-like [Limulus polyphemus]
MAIVGVVRAVSKSTKIGIRYILGTTNVKSPFISYHSSVRLKSSPTTVVSPDATVDTARKSNEETPPERDPLDLTFENTQAAYKSKKTWELVRGLLVLKLSSYPYLVENHEKLLGLAQRILGKRLFQLLMKLTFYGHFVAGKDAQDIKPTIECLGSFGVKSILDYSAEEDLSEEEAKEAEMASCISAADETKSKDPSRMKQFQVYEQFADRRKYNVTARTYFYLSEAQCERNVDTFLKCIDAVAGATKSTGLAAIKMTALGRPQVLIQLSEVIVNTRKYFKEVTGTQKNMIMSNVKPSYIEHKLDDMHVNTHQDEVVKWLQQMDYDKKGLMNIFSWSDLVDMNYVLSELFKVPSIKTGRMEPLIRALTDEEEEMFKNMMRRLHYIAQVAREKDVRVMIDAEQTYFQPAISRITMELMRKYNKEKAIIFNTYQCYLKEAYNNVVLDLELAKRQGIFFGAKLVRGAYMEQERLRAKQGGYEDPINPTYEATSDMYERTLNEIMHQIITRGDRKIAIMVATHNEDTVRFTVNKMKELGIKPDEKLVCFGQLYGMCDQISFPLGQSGYSVYKYVPYGPVQEVLPYLSRRARENSSLLSKLNKERYLLRTEIIRRIKSGQVFHTPKGNYTPV